MDHVDGRNGIDTDAKVNGKQRRVKLKLNWTAISHSNQSCREKQMITLMVEM